MSNLQNLRTSITSFKKTEKITKAMKMIALSKLKKSRNDVVNFQSFSDNISEILHLICAHIKNQHNSTELLNYFNDSDKKLINKLVPQLLNNQEVIAEGNKCHLLLVFSTNKGLCGGLNSNLFKYLQKKIHALHAQGVDVRILCFGKKVFELLKNSYSDLLINDQVDFDFKQEVSYNNAVLLANIVLDLYTSDYITNCGMIYNKFISSLVQKVSYEELLPIGLMINQEELSKKYIELSGGSSLEFSSNSLQSLKEIVPQNLSSQCYFKMLQSFASEQAARMIAMDNAVNNCKKLMDHTKLTYNRLRQSCITKEIIEIISGIEALK